MKYTTKQILGETKHRDWDYPTKPWRYYQEWNNALFFHYKIDTKVLRELVPKDLEIDEINGSAWVSLVAFTMEKIRPRFLPSFPPISDFDEINLRTYVTKDGKPGVYFLSIEAGKLLSAIIAKALSGLPYEKSETNRTENSYKANHPKRNFSLLADFYIGMEMKHKTDLDLFLTERYCLYLEENNNLFRYEIQHLPWKINQLEIEFLKIDYQINDLLIDSHPDLIHYSEGVQVVAWEKERL
ncbi:YqjF family protein [Empedobacter brevis]|uniref:YqjF family protein n=1 Tax=Empedobacter brevis TaxID=247 RepID=UPI0039AFCD94